MLIKCDCLGQNIHIRSTQSLSISSTIFFVVVAVGLLINYLNVLYCTFNNFKHNDYIYSHHSFLKKHTEVSKTSFNISVFLYSYY